MHVLCCPAGLTTRKQASLLMLYANDKPNGERDTVELEKLLALFDLVFTRYGKTETVLRRL